MANFKYQIGDILYIGSRGDHGVKYTVVGRILEGLNSRVSYNVIDSNGMKHNDVQESTFTGIIETGEEVISKWGY
jgi:hypothetical protein